MSIQPIHSEDLIFLNNWMPMHLKELIDKNDFIRVAQYSELFARFKPFLDNMDSMMAGSSIEERWHSRRLTSICYGLRAIQDGAGDMVEVEDSLIKNIEFLVEFYEMNDYLQLGAGNKEILKIPETWLAENSLENDQYY